MKNANRPASITMALSASSLRAAAVFLACCALCVDAAETASQSTDECFSSASVVGAVLGTAIVLLGLEGGAYMLWRLYWRSRRGQHLVLVTDPEKGGEYAFDNPCFKDATPVSKSVLEPVKADQKNNKWTSWGGLGGLGGLGAIRNNLGGLQGEKRRAMDDSYTATTEPQVTQVLLRSHDFTGLGFNICGNMRDGIFVKDVLHRGPASESKLIFPGDRIHGIRISLRHMVFEDALTILSYASPYEVTLEVETGTASGASSRPSSLLRREKEKEALAAERIVHPFYRSQSIADLAQIGKATHKRAHAVDSPSRSEHGDYPTLKLQSSQTSPAHVRAQGPTLHTSTPHAHAHARLEQAAAVIKPERTSVHAVHKLGVRVLPAGEPTEKRQNVHNTYLERGIDVPDGYNPYAPAPAPASAQPLAQAPAPHAAQEGFQDVDLGVDKASAADEHHKVGVVARDVKTKFFSKGLHNLLHSLDRNKKAVPAAEARSPTPPVAQEAVVETTNTSMAVNTSSASTESEVMTRKPSGRGIPTEIPEEVHLAAMAARSNRKSLGALSVEVIESAIAGEADRGATSPGGVVKRKGLAPRPPSAPVTPVAPVTPASASPSSLASSPASASVALVNGDESLASLQSLHSLPMHSDTESEADSPLPSGLASGPRTTIELTSSHVTVHHSHSLGLEDDTTRKAASLGDLSRIGDKLAGVAVLERAVSLDLDAPSHGKKRKAPTAPASEADDLDDDLSLDAMDDAGVYAMARKEPRLDMVGLGMNTFERSRLKKSSDWGTLEEALASDKGSSHVQVLSSTAPTVAEVHPKGELKNSFFVGAKMFGHDSFSASDEQPFSFSASSMEPLSIEVRAEAVPAVSASSATSASSDRDRVLWSVPGEDDQAGSSRVSVTSPSSMDVVEVTGTEPASGPSSLSSLTIVSSTPMRPSGPSGPSHDAPRDAVQSPLVSSSEVNRALVSSTSAAFVSTTQLNSLEMDTTDAAFLSAVDSSTLMMDAADSLDSDDVEVTASSPPDLPTSPAPMSSLTYVTEIQVTTPDSSKVHNGFPSPNQSPSPRSSSPITVGVDTTPEAAEVTVSPASPEMSHLEQSVVNVNGGIHDASPAPAPAPAPVPAATTLPTSSPTASPSASPAASSTPSPSASPPRSPPRSPPTPAVAASGTTPKAGRNVSVTAIQGSRIPVRSASHSPDDRAPSASARGTGGGASPSPSAATSPLRPPVPARRSADLTPRKANGVQVVSTLSEQAP